MSKRFHNRTVACSCGAELTDIHRDICPVYEKLTNGDLTHESPPVVIAKQQQAEADKLEADHKAEQKAKAKADLKRFSRPAATYKRTQGHKVAPINSIANALNAALSAVHR